MSSNISIPKVPSDRWTRGSYTCRRWTIGARYTIVLPVPVAALTSLKPSQSKKIHKENPKRKGKHKNYHIIRTKVRNTEKDTHAVQRRRQEWPVPGSAWGTRNPSYLSPDKFDSVMTMMIKKRREGGKRYRPRRCWQRKGWRPRSEKEQEAKRPSPPAPAATSAPFFFSFGSFMSLLVRCPLLVRVSLLSKTHRNHKR